jgi:peptidoglycan/LPS O-acetylase OafA/YrhL
VVFLSHAAFSNFSSGWLAPFDRYGPMAVMVFFVLSGFVIAYVVDTRHPTARRFVTDRAARLYSVALPAIVITFLADKVGIMFDPGLYYCCFGYSNPLFDMVISGLFLNEIWFYGMQPFSNGPYWSISFEAAYYLLFALFLFPPPKWRVPLILIAALAVGPLILLLAPVWFIGVGAYHLSKRWSGSLPAGAALFAGSSLALIALLASGIPEALTAWTDSLAGETGVEMMRKTNVFLTDYILGVIVALNFVGAVIVGRHLKPAPNWIAGPIRYCAGFTFSLYLYHFPLLLMYSVLLGHDPASASDQAVLYGVTLATCWGLGLVTERKKGFYRAMIDRAWSLADSVSRRVMS